MVINSVDKEVKSNMFTIYPINVFNKRRLSRSDWLFEQEIQPVWYTNIFFQDKADIVKGKKYLKLMKESISTREEELK